MDLPIQWKVRLFMKEVRNIWCQSVRQTLIRFKLIAKAYLQYAWYFVFNLIFITDCSIVIGTQNFSLNCLLRGNIKHFLNITFHFRAKGFQNTILKTDVSEMGSNRKKPYTTYTETNKKMCWKNPFVQGEQIEILFIIKC